jgi:SAM-dependent methyltransferase
MQQFATTAPEALACPSCGAALAQAPETVSCCSCGTRWPIIEGVPHFIGEFPYWGEIPHEQMIEVNRRAAAGCWKSALLDFDDPAVRKAVDMILNLERANWSFLVRLPRNSRVLDVGAGMGTTTHSLSRYYRDVVALEPVAERVEFMRHRFLQEHLENVSVVRGSIWCLPFGPETFDLIAMNGVLEWVAESRGGDPGQVQTEALERIYRLLRPGGYAYIGIENRMSPLYFAGARDPHCGLPYVTVLPRPLAQWYARRRGQNGYRNYLYSSRGYRRLLRKAGFRAVEIYLASPSYNHPRVFVPLKRRITSFYLRHLGGDPGSRLLGAVRRFLRLSGLLDTFEYSFAIIARK